MLASIQQELSRGASLLAEAARSEKVLRTIEAVVCLAVDALRNGNKILLCGNGGSAADAQHWAGELVSRFHFDRPALPAIALTTDTSILTAIGNDYGYEQLFARQIQALGAKGDILFAISTSGRSANVLAAVKEAKTKAMITIGFTGAKGGDLAGLADHCIQAPSSSTPDIQLVHEAIGHTICMLIEEQLFKKSLENASAPAAPEPSHETRVRSGRGLA